MSSISGPTSRNTSTLPLTMFSKNNRRARRVHRFELYSAAAEEAASRLNRMKKVKLQQIAHLFVVVKTTDWKTGIILKAQAGVWVPVLFLTQSTPFFSLEQTRHACKKFGIFHAKDIPKPFNTGMHQLCAYFLHVLFAYMEMFCDTYIAVFIDFALASPPSQGAPWPGCKLGTASARYSELVCSRNQSRIHLSVLIANCDLHIHLPRKPSL